MARRHARAVLGERRFEGLATPVGFRSQTRPKGVRLIQVAPRRSASSSERAVRVASRSRAGCSALSIGPMVMPRIAPRPTPGKPPRRRRARASSSAPPRQRPGGGAPSPA